MCLSAEWQKVWISSRIAQGASHPYLTLSGRRGLPLGYLNQLEQRLIATETALYGALATLQSTSPTVVFQASAKPESVHKSKSARTDEWSQLPLDGWSDMKRWMTAVSDQFIVEQSPGVPLTQTSMGDYPMSSTSRRDNVAASSVQVDRDRQGLSIHYAWQPREGIHMGSLYESHSQRQDMRSSVGLQEQVTQGPEVVATPIDRMTGRSNMPVINEGDHARVELADREQPSRAEELSKLKPGIYF